MADERQEFSFNVGNFGSVSTEDLIDAGESFLNTSPDEIVPKKVETPPKTESEKKEKTEGKEKPEVKEVIVPKNEVEEEDIYSALEGKINKEDDEEGEEVGKKTEKKADGQQSTVETDNEEANVFTSIAKELVAQGIFSQDEDEEGNPVDPEIDTPEEFLERFQVESRRSAADIIDKFLEKFGDEYKDMFENVFVRGVPPTDYLNRFAKIQGIKDLDLKDEGNQERLVRELYRSEGRSSEYIEKRITQLKNYSDLPDEAAEAQRILIDKEQKANDAAAQSKQQEIGRKQQIRGEYINSVTRILQEKLKNKEFDGIPVDKKLADDTYAYITQERYQTPDKQLLTEFDKDILDLNRPENHSLKVKMAILLQMAKVDPQLTKIGKKAVSKESNKLFQGLQKTANKTTSKNTTKEDVQENQPTSWFS